MLICVSMNKAHALRLLGGSVTAAAKACGITPSAVSQWPDDLPPRIADRVIAAVARQAGVAEGTSAQPTQQVTKPAAA